MNKLADEKIKPKLKHIPALDGLRGFAILSVALGHFMVAQNWKGQPLFNIASGGWIFVDCFFALSGFLVTSILLDTRQNTGYFRRFYSRRQLRIMPLYLFAVLVVFIVSTFVEGRPVKIFSYDSLIWYLFYLPNIAITFKTGWLEHSSWLGINHFWAVGVEEQFYILWPLIVYFTPRRWLLILSATILAIGTPIRVMTGYLFGDMWGLAPYTSTWCRMDAIAAGALVAILLRLRWDNFRNSEKRAHIPLIITCGIFAAALLSFTAWKIYVPFNPAAGINAKIDFWFYVIYMFGFVYVAYRIYQQRNEEDMLLKVIREAFKAVFAVMLVRMICDLGYGAGQEKLTHSTLCFGSLIYVLATAEKQSLLKSFFESRFLTHIGFFSYGIYLFHHMLRPIYARTIEQWFFIDAALNPFLAQLLYIAVASICSYFLARLSWILIEQPFVKLKNNHLRGYKNPACILLIHGKPS